MKEGRIEVFLMHPGGPFYKNQDEGVWDFPKGGAKEGEDLLEAAKREFNEETSHTIDGNFDFLGSLKHNGKEVHIWAIEGDIDPEKFKSITTFIDWPPLSGKKIEIPEMDIGVFFSFEEALNNLRPYLIEFIDRFESNFK
jgi:predicted NUDIX family NTP pyrophosphohydrolase